MNSILKKTFLPLAVLLLLAGLSAAQEKRAYKAPEFARNWSKPGQHPDHIVLNLTEDPATSMSITWRTDTTISEGFAEIALATAAPRFWRNASTLKAATQTLDASEVLTAEVVSNYHTVTFTGLQPDTLYAYRVGDGNIWSEWIQFRTASDKPKPFSFLYVGDAQNYILELWSRLIREGYRKAPDASFIIHAGDLVSDAHSERQWHEWFTAGGWIHRMLPSISTPGNHEYSSINQAERQQRIRQLSVQWNPQFNLPQNGPEGLDETVYYIDYQNTRIISLNSNRMQEEQAAWLEGVLSDNPQKWTVVTYHHPLFSASTGRDNKQLRERWKPLFDKYQVDIALQGHDHTYARGYETPDSQNLTAGMNVRDYAGTVYVVSVSGGKMYNLMGSWEEFGLDRKRGAENTQLFQLIEVNGDTLSFAAYTATGELYDAFDLIKQENGPNRVIERTDMAIAPRRHFNTISYEDELPDGVAENLLKKYSGYEIDRVRYVAEEEFTGYYVQLEKGREAVSLTLDAAGEILEEEVKGGR